ncbi:putative T7SS-secreted protein [Streptomyces chrestomyceticus]|uniref:Putative T7SS secretion signal domain-containing protein n=1 Tax=Streptomyces chrestomyceticus TaxID=68185 RepID=A0ABU7WXE8_9ACTN
MATRPGDWGALGLDGDPTPGDASAITTIADAMRDLATHAGTINNGLKALQQTAGDGQRFIGKTADQLRDMVDDHLHNFVGHVADSFNQAETALRKYATAVTDAQADADAALTAAQGLDKDDPQLQTHKDRADDAKSALSSAASTLDKSLTSAGSLMVQPVSDCDMFWEAFQWLTIILSVIAIFTGGVLAILAWGMNAVLLIKTIVDFSQGKASGLELGLAFLGVLFPTTKALPVGSILKGLGSVLKGGVEGIAGAGKNIIKEIGHFSSLHNMPKVVVAPIVLGIHAAPAFNIVNGMKGLGNFAKGGWESLAGTVVKDWATVTKNFDGNWNKLGAYAKVTFERLGRAGIATVVPLDFTEMGVLGFGGAARLAFGERVLGISQPDLHRLLANAGRTDAALAKGIHTGDFGALAPFRPVGGNGVHFVPGSFVDLSALHFVPGGFGGVSFPGVHIPSVSPGGLTKFPGALVPNNISGLHLNGLNAFRPGGLGTFTFNGVGNLMPNGIGSFGHSGLNLNIPGNLGGLGVKGLGNVTHVGGNMPHGVTVPNGITVPHTGVTTPQGITVPSGSLTHTGTHVDQPGLIATPDLHLPGTTTLDNGLSVPDVHNSGATQLIQQTDFAAGHVRMDSNLLLSGNTAIDLLKDAHGASGVLGHVPESTAVHVPETSFENTFVHGIGDGHSMARGAIGHGEALEDMTFPELTALANGDVAVTAFHGDGISFRIGDAAPRTITADHLAATAPGTPVTTAPQNLTNNLAGTQHVPGSTQVPGVHGGAETIRPTGVGAQGDLSLVAGAVPPPRNLAKAPGDVPASVGANDPVRLKTPDFKADKTPVAGTGATAKTTPQPVVNEHDMAMSLLDTGDRKPVPSAGHSATSDSPSGVSALPDLDGAGARGASGPADNSVLDLIAHPGGPAKAGDEAAAGIPAAVKATDNAPAPTPVPAPKAETPTPAPGPKEPGAATAPPGNRFGGFSGAAALNHRLRARNDLILGGSVGPEAGAKLNAWVRYENALSQLGKAERQVDELAPPPGVTAGEPSPALAKALDDLGVQRAEVAEAEAKLDELGIDAARTRTQINALTGGIFGGHGLGGGPRPHPQPETQAVPAVDKGKGTADLAGAEPVPAVGKGKGAADFADFEPVPHADQGKADFEPVPHADQGKADFEPVPSVDKGKGKADFEPVPSVDKGKADFTDSTGLGPVPETHLPRPPAQDRLGHTPGSGIGDRAAARHEIVTGGASGPEAELRLNAWERYEQASFDLAQAQGKADRLVPGAGHPGPSKPSAAAVDALDDLNVKRSEFHDAESRLGELDMDPNAIRQQIDDANDAIAVDRAQRGEYVGPLGGAPAPHGGDPLPVGPHDWSPDPQAPRALWPEPGTHAAGRTMVNQSFRDLPYAGHQPLTAGDYLSWMRGSTGEGRPLSYVVNTIVSYGEIGGGKLQDFLDSITRGLAGYDGRLGVVIGVNGKLEDLAAIHRAMDDALASTHFDHPLAMVATTFYGESFPYGTMRNLTMTSPAARSMAHSMMHGGGAAGPSHPYWAFMDFDVYEHTVPSGRHVFDHFDRELNLGPGGAVDDWIKKLPDDAGAAAKGADGSVTVPGVPDAPPLRPLVMTGGYRVPGKTGETVIVDGVAVDRSVEDLIKATKTRGDTPDGMVFTQQDVDKFASVVDSDMRIRALMSDWHGLLPYGPEPNLFVDAAVTMVDDVKLAAGDWRPVRFGGGSGEYKGLRERLNHFHAWELDQTLPDVPGNTVAREIAAANSVLPDRGTAFVADFVNGAVPTDLSRLMSGYYKHGKAGGVGNMPQEHLTPKNVVEHVFARDTFDLDPSLSRAKDDTKIAKLRDDLLKGKSPEQGFRDDPLKPIGIDGRRPEFNEHPRATLDRLGAGLGGDANTLGLNISIRVPGRTDGLVVGIVPADKRFLSHAVVTATEEAAYKRLQNYVIAEVLPQGGLPDNSLLRALPEPPPATAGGKGGRITPGAIPDAPTLLTQVQRQMGKNGFEDLINDTYTRGLDGRALTNGLVTGRLGPDVSDLGPIERIVLDRYAKAFNRPLEIRGLDGSAHRVDIEARKPGPPLHLTWVPDHGGPHSGHWDVSNTAPPARLGFEPGSGIGERSAVRHDIITGGTGGPEADLRLGAWQQYEQASFDLAKAQEKADGLVPKAGQPGPSKPSAAAVDALDDLGVKQAEFGKAEARLDELGMDPNAIQRQIDDAHHAIAVDRAQRGEYVGPLGGAPSRHTNLTQAFDDLDVAGGASAHHGDDLDMTDAPAGAGDDAAPTPHGDDPMDGTGPYGDLGHGGPPTAGPLPRDLQWQQDVPNLGIQVTRGDVTVNNAFQRLPGFGQRPLTPDQYTNWIHASLDRQNPMAYVVNTVVRASDIAGEAGRQRLRDFLTAITTDPRGAYEGKFAVVIGVNGRADKMADINAAVRGALDGLDVPYPVAAVGIGWTGKDFPFGTVRNVTMTSPPSRYLVRSMMYDPHQPAHPYFSFMDFDTYQRLVPSGDHVFQHFVKEFAMGGDGIQPLRPLTMSGGYRLPEGNVPGADTAQLIEDTNKRLAEEHAKDVAKGKAVGPPHTVSEADLPAFDTAVRADMRARTRLVGIHPLLPYSPEPNLFTDAAATLLDRVGPGWQPIRFSPGTSEFNGLAETLNSFNAWELNRTLPVLDRSAFPGDSLVHRLTDREIEAVAQRPYDRAYGADVDTPTAGQIDAVRQRLAARGPGGGSDGPLSTPEIDAVSRLLTPGELNAIATRQAERLIAAHTNTLPDRGVPFVTDFEGAATPTDLSRMMEGLFGNRPALPQDHNDVRQAMGRMFGRDSFEDVDPQTSRRVKGGLHWAERRDDHLTKNSATGLSRDPLAPVDPGHGSTHSPRDVVDGLDGLGTDRNTLGFNVSAPVPDDSGLALRAGVPLNDKAFASLAAATHPEPAGFMRNLHLVVAGYPPVHSPPRSLFHALENAADSGPGHTPGGLLDAVEQYLRSKPKGSKDPVVKLVLAEADRAGTGSRELFATLATGRIDPHGSFAAGSPAELSVRLYAQGLGARIRIIDGDGTVVHEAAPGTTGARTRPRPGLDFRWESDPGGGWHWTVRESDDMEEPAGQPVKRPRKGKGRAVRNLRPDDEDTTMGDA